MDKAKIFQDLTEIFRDVFDDAHLVIARDMAAEDIAGWDSARMIELIIAAEMHFDMKFSSREIDSLSNFGDFVDLIDARNLHD